MESYIKKKLSAYPVNESPQDGDLIPCIVSNGDGTFSQFNIPYSSLKGAPGDPGSDGQGVPTGGSTGQVLKKNSNTSFDAGWITLDKSSVGLGNVDNTSDTNKPVSTAVQTAIDAAVLSTKQALYPVGSIYFNATNNTNPGSLLGFGTWVAWGAGRVPVGFDSTQTEFDTAEETGGSKTQALTAANLPAISWEWSGMVPGSYQSDFRTSGGVTTVGGGMSGLLGSGGTGSINAWKYGFGVGSNTPHNNLQPYITVYMWKRTA